VNGKITIEYKIQKFQNDNQEILSKFGQKENNSLQ
jgi:hypothetical protein